jgi:hypothetical protein
LQYELWREKYPEKPFYELQFLFPSGIWGSEDDELTLDERIRQFNSEMASAGLGSRRPIYPVGDQIVPLDIESSSAMAHAGN